MDILWALTSWNTFDQLYRGRGLEQPAAADRLVTMARLTLCRPGRSCRRRARHHQHKIGATP